jgi:nucleotide-binding universal stress UspA family protein
MAFKDLLVHLDGSERSVHRLDYAVGLAERHDAHLSALYIPALVPEPEELVRFYSGHVEQFEAYATMRNVELDRAKQAEARFREALRREGLAGEWRFVESLPAETMSLHARYADLAIVGQIDPEHRPSASAARIPGDVLLTAGRPVLIVPYIAPPQTYGENVVVAWTATREAARALGDALPFLERAKTVTVLTVNPDRGPDSEPGIPAADIALHLARHGVRAEAAVTVAKDIAIGDALLNYLFDSGADLLVMGGYGHSRAREAVLGGVTRQILEHMTVPVLMSH